LKYFASGITSTIVDMLLRGMLGFQRSDDCREFYLTPRSLGSAWQGIDNLPLNGETKLAIRVKDQGRTTACTLKFSGLQPDLNAVMIVMRDMRAGTEKQVARLKLGAQGEAAIELEKINETRYLWKLQNSGDKSH